MDEEELEDEEDDEEQVDVEAYGERLFSWCVIFWRRYEGTIQLVRTGTRKKKKKKVDSLGFHPWHDGRPGALLDASRSTVTIFNLSSVLELRHPLSWPSHSRHPVLHQRPPADVTNNLLLIVPE